MPSSSSSANATTTVVNKTIRVCVLTPSYENSDSATKEWDNIVATPKHFFPDDFVETTTTEEEVATVGDKTTTTTTVTTNTSYTFAYVELNKATVYRDLRGIIKSGKYDVFFNLCDGARDEDRAGEEVVRTLEEFNVPFTGAASKYFELSKPDMKMMAHYARIPTARHAVLDADDLLPASGDGPAADGSAAAATAAAISPAGDGSSASPTSTSSSSEDGGAVSSNHTANSANVNLSAPLRLEAKCAHLRFPVIVKHVSGYASIGMTKENKCETMTDLKIRAAIFIAEFDFALVEEFIVGDEATVLACADDSAPDGSGIRVFMPVMVNFPEGSDFKHFELKWASYEGMEWQLVPPTDPSLQQIIDIGRRSFKEMMGGIGYGRCDLRINRERNEVVFLEINPNCGIMYPPTQEGSADYILQMEGEKRQREKGGGIAADPAAPIIIDKLKGQRDFAILQIRTAMARCERTKPLWYRSFDSDKGFHLRAVKAIKKGTVVFNDEGRSVRLFTKPFVDRTWTAEEREVFAENAWPIGGGTSSNTNTSSGSSAVNSQQQQHYFAVWDINPSNWRTFNHSDDPHANLVFAPHRSLNVVAARDIAKGEELTMNYELLRSENMPSPKPNTKGATGAGGGGNFSGSNSAMGSGSSTPPPAGAI